MNLSPDKQREMLRQMLTIRRFEERARYRATPPPRSGGTRLGKRSTVSPQPAA